jgi:hypothetical protein
LTKVTPAGITVSSGIVTSATKALSGTQPIESVGGGTSVAPTIVAVAAGWVVASVAGNVAVAVPGPVESGVAVAGSDGVGVEVISIGGAVGIRVTSAIGVAGSRAQAIVASMSTNTNSTVEVCLFIVSHLSRSVRCSGD